MINKCYYSEVDSPLGVLTLTGNGDALTGLYLSLIHI